MPNTKRLKISVATPHERKLPLASIGKTKTGDFIRGVAVGKFDSTTPHLLGFITRSPEEPTIYRLNGEIMSYEGHADEVLPYFHGVVVRAGVIFYQGSTAIYHHRGAIEGCHTLPTGQILIKDGDTHLILDRPLKRKLLLSRIRTLFVGNYDDCAWTAHDIVFQRDKRFYRNKETEANLVYDYSGPLGKIERWEVYRHGIAMEVISEGVHQLYYVRVGKKELIRTLEEGEDWLIANSQLVYRKGNTVTIGTDRYAFDIYATEWATHPHGVYFANHGPDGDEYSILVVRPP